MSDKVSDEVSDKPRWVINDPDKPPDEEGYYWFMIAGKSDMYILYVCDNGDVITYEDSGFPIPWSSHVDRSSHYRWSEPVKPPPKIA